MKSKTFEKIIQSMIYDYIMRELACVFSLRNCFLRKDSIRLYGARVSSVDGLYKVNFSMTDILIFEGDQAHIMNVTGVINEFGDIYDFDVYQKKGGSRAESRIWDTYDNQRQTASVSYQEII